MTDKARIGAGDVEIELDGERLVLKPTAEAGRAISRMDGGIINAIEKASRFDYDTIVNCVALGLGRPVKDIEDQAWRTGLATLAAPVMRYCTMLANGGRPPKESGGEEGADPR